LLSGYKARPIPLPACARLVKPVLCFGLGDLDESSGPKARHHVAQLPTPRHRNSAIFNPTRYAFQASRAKQFHRFFGWQRMWHSLFDTLWFTFAYPVSLLLAVGIGYAFAEVYYRRRHQVWKPSGIESALITIFGLLLSFTLLSSSNALKERTALIHQAADAVLELHQESQLLPRADQVAIRVFLLRFLRLELMEHRPGRPHDPAHTRQLTTLYTQVWRPFRNTMRAVPTRAAGLRQLLPAFNRLQAATSRLHYANQERTPAPIMWLLLLSSWAIGVLVGFTNSAQDTRHYFVPVLFVVISALTIQAIRDLDNPEVGYIRPDYGNLQDLQHVLTQEQRRPW